MLQIKNVVTRALSGFVFISILIGGMLINQHTFLLVFCFITALALYEFYGLIDTAAGVKTSRILNTLGGMLFFCGAYLLFSKTLSSFLAFVPFASYLLVLFISELYLKRPNPILSLAYTTLGLIYIAVPLSLLNYLAFSYDVINSAYHYAFLLALFVFIWVNDTFAYLSGSMFGKHRMFERISPKKSWEGFIGGAVCAIIASVIFSHFFTLLPLWGWVGYAFVMIVFGTLGDLIESLFKRTLNVKDSGNILPGHGGILDRIDSVIFSIPALFIFIEIIIYFTHNK